MRCFYSLIFVVCSVIASANELPESSIARYNMRALFTSPQTTVRNLGKSIIDQGLGMPQVRLDIERGDKHLYLIFLPEMNGTFSFPSLGSYVVRRSLSNNFINQVKIVLSPDGTNFLRLRPHNKGTVLDVYQYNVLVYKNISLPVPFATVLVNSFSLIREVTTHLVPWSQLIHNAAYIPEEAQEQYERVHAIADVISAELAGLPDAEDGAMDEAGNLVYIDDLRMQDGLPGFNCSGFAKWVADGFYYPQYGRYVALNNLKERHLNVRGSVWGNGYEYIRDPYFGLDWIRNIALTVHALAGVKSSDPEAFDVRDNTIVSYIEDIGYPVRDLASVLYKRIVDKPGEIYFASINRPFSSNSPMLLRQHVHIVVLFPYIDKSGTFHIRVLERNVETSMQSLLSRYANDYIHLVATPSHLTFQAPKFVAN